jgi:hypothetical protein
MRNRRRVAAFALLLVTGCGTTVPMTSTRTGAGPDELGGPAAPGAQSQTQGSSPQAPPGSDAPAGGSGTTGRGGGVGAPPAPGSVPTSTSGPVATSRAPVRVGLLYIDGADTLAGSLGISGLTTGDTRAQARAIVSHLDSHGGLAGRRIDLRYGRMDAASLSSDIEGTHAQACSALTEDEKVAYVVSYVQLSSTQLACYAKRGVTVLNDQSSVLDSTGAQYASTFGSPGELALGRATEQLVDALWRRGWLTSKSKVGTFVYDTPDGALLETRHLVPALARHGLTPVVKARSSNDAGGANQSGTVVKMASQGVDRVIPIGASPLFLMNAAESQGYRPAYAMTSTFGPGALIESSAPRGQLKNAAGIGWSKYLDIGTGKRPGAVSRNETLCFSIMRAAGQQTTSTTTQAFQAALCNVLMFLQAAVGRYGVTPDVLNQVRRSGLDFPPADAFAIRMQPGRADGVAAYRDLRFDEACGCFQYVGGNRST